MTLGLWGRLGVAGGDWSVPRGSGDACGDPIARSKCPAAPAAAHASPSGRSLLRGSPCPVTKINGNQWNLIDFISMESH